MNRLNEFTQSVQSLSQQVRNAVPTEAWSLLPTDFQPRHEDVICAKGKQAQQHPGNLRFVDVIEQNLDRYTEAPSKFEKTMVVSEIMSSVYHCSGVFVRRDSKSGRWCQIDDDAARKKTGQAIRDMLEAKNKTTTSRCHSGKARQQQKESLKKLTCSTFSSEFESFMNELGIASDEMNNHEDSSKLNNKNDDSSSSSPTTSSLEEDDDKFDPLPLRPLFVDEDYVDWFEFVPLLHLCFDAQ